MGYAISALVCTAILLMLFKNYDNRNCTIILIIICCLTIFFSMNEIIDYMHNIRREEYEDYNNRKDTFDIVDDMNVVYDKKTDKYFVLDNGEDKLRGPFLLR